MCDRGGSDGEIAVCEFGSNDGMVVGCARGSSSGEVMVYVAGNVVLGCDDEVMRRCVCALASSSGGL